MTALALLEYGTASWLVRLRPNYCFACIENQQVRTLKMNVKQIKSTVLLKFLTIEIQTSVV